MFCTTFFQALALPAEIDAALTLLGYGLAGALGAVLALGWSHRASRTRALIRHNRELEQTLAARDQLLENTVHELRTPLTTVMASVEMLRDGYATTDEERQTLYDQSAASGTHLLFLINDLLDAAALRAGQLRVESEPCPVAALLEQTVRSLSPVAAARSCTLASRCESNGLEVLADPNRLLQVMFNLTGNAVKFSDAGGEVTIRARRDAEGVCIEVVDTGIGVPAAARHALFARFSRVHSPRASSAHGTGLGLQLCQVLIERMGGRIGYRPNPSGIGSVFWFWLAAATATAAAATPRAPRTVVRS